MHNYFYKKLYVEYIFVIYIFRVFGGVNESRNQKRNSISLILGIFQKRQQFILIIDINRDTGNSVTLNATKLDSSNYAYGEVQPTNKNHSPSIINRSESHDIDTTGKQT